MQPLRIPLEPCGAPSEIDVNRYSSLNDMFEQAVSRYKTQVAYSCLGHDISFQQLDEMARQFASYLQHNGFQPGDRIAIQLPNILQYPVALFGSLMAGLVVVNTNPLYTPRELSHQLNDSGARAIVVLANIADTLEKVVADTPVERVIMTELADLHPLPKRYLINGVVKYLKRMVPKTHFEKVVSFRRLLSEGARQVCEPVKAAADDLAVLQYTGGTTGVAKGAMLSHGNIVANVLQCMEVFKTYNLRDGEETMLMPLPFYHIYSFTVGMTIFAKGNRIVLVPNPRDIAGLIKEAVSCGMTIFCGINTLFVAMLHHSQFSSIDFSKLHLTLAGGMALNHDTSRQWHERTGTEIYQGYGLTEASPVVAVNYGGHNLDGTIGVPVPSTEIKLLDSEGVEVGGDEVGELCVRGPQVMQGYWQKPDETAQVLDDDGWLRTGDMVKMEVHGRLQIVDRIKDLIIVSGFNVYPNEVEDVASESPLVCECAAIGVPDESRGEVVKLFVVPEHEGVEAKDILAFCRQELTGYKVPKYIEFRDDLPKSNVGKILRKELRGQPN